MRHPWRPIGAAFALSIVATAACAGSTGYMLTGTWTKVASAGATVDVQIVGGAGAVLATSASPPAAGAAGLALAGSGDHRVLTLSADLYASSAGGATIVVTDSIGSGGSVSIGAAGSSCDAALTSGGAAQTLCAGAQPPNGWAVYNPNATDDLWCSDSATAASNGLGSVRIVANGGGYETPPGYRPAGPVSCVGPTAGDKITARRW